MSLRCKRRSEVLGRKYESQKLARGRVPSLLPVAVTLRLSVDERGDAHNKGTADQSAKVMKDTVELFIGFFSFAR